MAERTAKRHLTAEALESGLREQYAVLRRTGKIIIELGMAEGGKSFEVSKTHLDYGGTSTITAATFTHLNKARAAFRELVRKNP